MLARLKLLYVLLSAFTLALLLYKEWTLPSADRNPNPMGFVWCLLLFTVTPYVGYVLVFKFVPVVVRFARR